MLNGKVLRNLGIVAVLAVLAFFLVNRITIARVASAEVSAAARVASAGVSAVPFLLEMDIARVDGNGQMKVDQKRTFARRSDGTGALIESVGPLAWGAYGRKITFTSGRSLSLIDLVKSKSTWPASSAAEVAFLKQRLTHPRQDCAYTGTFVGNDVVMGEPVAVVQFPIPVQPGEKRCAAGGKPIVSQRFTSWLAPRLGCEYLQYRVEVTRPDGSVELVVEGRPTRLDFVEPDEQYFDEGSGYIETNPSKILSSFLGLMGLKQDDSMCQQGMRMDKNYQSTR